MTTIKMKHDKYQETAEGKPLIWKSILPDASGYSAVQKSPHTTIAFNDLKKQKQST
jgi:hypothetical protein